MGFKTERDARLFFQFQGLAKEIHILLPGPGIVAGHGGDKQSPHLGGMVQAPAQIAEVIVEASVWLGNPPVAGVMAIAARCRFGNEQ